MSADTSYRRATQVIHAGRQPEKYCGFVNPPVCHGSTVLYPTAQDFRSHRSQYSYWRRGNPTMDSLTEALKRMSGAAGVVICPSGLSAISTALLSVAGSGDHILVSDSVYLPTREFCDSVLRRMGVETTYYDPKIGSNITQMMRANTSAIYCESPGSLSFEIQDIPALSQVARQHQLALILDNTWAGPLFFDAHGKGAHIVIESGTKYLSGHSDLVMGTVSASDKYWSRLHHTWGTMGICTGPDDMFLALRGLRSLKVRLDRHQASALEIAHWLNQRKEISEVWHPALPSCPGHDIWRRDFTGSSGLFSVVLNSRTTTAQVDAFLDSLDLFGMGYSWGGFESLVIPFDCSGFRTATRWAPQGTTLRFHIGLEDPADLIQDLERAFGAMMSHAAP